MIENMYQELTWRKYFSLTYLLQIVKKTLKLYTTLNILLLFSKMISRKFKISFF